MAAPRLTFPPHSVSRTVLPNGLTVLLRVDRSAPVAAVVTYVRAGYFDEPDDVVGIAHVLEHMYFKGTPTRGVGEIAKQTKASGGYLNAATIYDHTRYYAVLPASGFARGLEIQADAFARSVIDGDELRRELEVIIEEARRKADSPTAVATETLYELLHDRHRIRRWRIGREAGLRRLTREQLLTFYQTWYRPSNTILSIVGDVDEGEVMRQVSSLYGALPDERARRDRGPMEAEPPGQRYRELAGDVAQAQVAFGWRTVPANHPDTVALDLAAMVLGAGRSSRLYRAVRERRFASDVSAYNYTPTDVGVFVVQLEGESAMSVAAAQAAWQEVMSLRRAAARAEVARAQRLFDARWLRRLESMDGQANYLADWEALGGWELGDEYAERTRALTPKQVSDAVSRHLDPQHASALVYRPERAPMFATDAESAFRLLHGAAHPPLSPVEMGDAAAQAPATRAPRRRRVEADVHVFYTGQRVPILVRQRPGTPIVHLGLLTLGGTAREDLLLCGLSTLMTRAALKGTTRRSAEAIAFESESLGGSISASVSSDGLGWAFSVPTHNFEAAVDLLADVVLHPALSADTLDTERRIAMSQLAQLRDDMSRYPMRLATEAAYRSHPYARGTLGTEAGLRAVGVDDVRAWHESQVLTGHSVLAVVGDVEPVDAARILAAAFDDLRFTKRRPVGAPGWVDHVTQRVEYRDKAQSALALAFPAPGRTDRDRFASLLLATIASGLGGRFFDELRDRQSLAYTVHASHVSRLMGGMFLSYIAMSPEKEDAARQGLLREFARLRQAPVTGEELERAKTYAAGTHAIAQQSGAVVVSEIIDAWVYGEGLSELDEWEARIRDVTAADIQRLATTYFDDTRRVEGIIRGTGRLSGG